jgi:hypothetical protein
MIPSGSEAFICPNGDMVCSFSGLCTEFENSGSREHPSFIDVVDAQLPVEVQEVLVTPCSNMRILALTKLAQISHDPLIERLAERRHRQITVSQSFFR